MRFIRLTALVISLGLLVATVVSGLYRRGDLRADQVARVEQSATLASTAIGASLSRVRQDVHLAALAATRNGASGDTALATELSYFFPGSDVCVGASASGCMGADLFSLQEVTDLAAASGQIADDTDASEAGAQATIAVDQGTDSLLVVRRIIESDDVAGGWVAVRLPISELVGEESVAAIAQIDAEFGLVARAEQNDDLRSDVELDGGRRLLLERIGSPFVDGSLVVTSSVDASVGIAGDQIARYVLLLAVGTVLLALAGWTFVIERRQLERRATTDDLTGLINRREFERVSDGQLGIADRYNTGLCVMVIDLNGFKQVNDTLGHQYGDLVLTASSERLVAAVRDTDVVARWGGDEFVILLPGLIERTAVRNRAELIWENLSGTPVVGDTVMTASIGAAIFPRHGTTLDALMRAADVAMYEAKSTGVGHRIADTITVGETLLAGEGNAPMEPQPDEVVTDEYAGPDRRHSPVLPPPPAPAPVPDGSEADDFDPPTSARIDEASRH